MALSKTTAIDLISATEDGVILWREVTKIMEDGNLLSQSYHRGSLEPGSDISEQPEKVQAICNAVWTPEVLAEWEARSSTPTLA